MRDELDALVNELNAGVPTREHSLGETAQAAVSAAGDAHLARLNDWLDELVRANGSDLLLVAGAVVPARAFTRLTSRPPWRVLRIRFRPSGKTRSGRSSRWRPRPC